MTKNQFFQSFGGLRFEDTFGLDFWAILGQIRKVRPSIHSPWRSRNACQAFLWKACGSCKFYWKKTSKKALKTTKINKKGLLKTSHFWIPFFHFFVDLGDVGFGCWGQFWTKKRLFSMCFLETRILSRCWTILHPILTIWGRIWGDFWEHLFEILAKVPKGFCFQTHGHTRSARRIARSA